MQNGLKQYIVVLLDRQIIDVTGDDRPDQVNLYGQKFSADTVYYDKLFLEVVDPASKKSSIVPLPGGYHPKMEFCDFTGDGITEIYIFAETGGSAGFSNFYMYSFENNIPKEIPTPPPLTIHGKFEDHYKVTIRIMEQNKMYFLDVSDRKNAYDQAGYYRDGKLLTPTNVLPYAYHVLRPVNPHKDGTCELFGIQHIVGFYNADTIAYATSLWKWHRNQWHLLSDNVQKTRPS